MLGAIIYFLKFLFTNVYIKPTKAPTKLHHQPALRRSEETEIRLISKWSEKSPT